MAARGLHADRIFGTPTRARILGGHEGKVLLRCKAIAEIYLMPGFHTLAFTSVTINACTPFFSDTLPVNVTFSPANFLALL